MTDAQQKKAAKEFANYWKDKGYEKGESQKFWLSLLQEILGVDQPEKFINFEDQVHLDNTSFIDGMIPSTQVMIEQKGSHKDLMKPIKQSDGTLLTPFQQAKRYSAELPYSQRPRWIVTCNFQTFHVYDMERPGGEPEVIELANLDKEYYRLSFLTETGNEHLKKEMEVSIAAGEIVGLIYDALLEQYNDPKSEKTLKSLNVLCVRLVFCLYAEDAGIFGHRGMFHDYLAAFDAHHMRKALKELFEILDTKPEDRDEYLEPELAAFPYVNGGLFADENIVIPQFTDEIRTLLLTKASDDFDWSEISPTIFGAVFESTLNPETRRSGGMHYTSIENIHKVIDPLFLDDLKKELEEIVAITVERTRTQKLKDFQNKLASLCWLDPAAGSGNFLTETYLSVRRLENEVIRMLQGEQMVMGVADPIKVSISQFYGIEINDFAVTVAKTALWIAESQMMKETEEIVLMNLDFLPLKTNANIIEGNALRLDWEEIVPKQKLNYIMGNPPFVGKKEQNKVQKNDLVSVFASSAKGIGNLDYVTGWYKKASLLIQGTTIRSAFVSTNSITQGEQAPVFWKLLYQDGVHIDFAYRTFRWDSEASLKAHVHCVIIGFSCAISLKPMYIFLNDSQTKIATNINPYLVDAPTVFIENRNIPICPVTEIQYGSMPIDDGNLILEKEDVDNLLKENPDNIKFIRKYVGGVELLRNKERWCLWLVEASPKDIQKSCFIMKRIQATAEFRKSSNRPQTLALANTPTLFGEIRQPNAKMLVIPKVSSETRRYIPICYVNPEIIVNGSALIVPNASLYEFGVLISNIHMAWMRTVAGRMKSDYQYSGKVVYNNFPWSQPTLEQQAKIEQTAQAILDARALYPDSSLADLYDELTMPPELRKAHQNNDRAVMQAYGFPIKGFTESDCVAELMKMYQKLTEGR